MVFYLDNNKYDNLETTPIELSDKFSVNKSGNKIDIVTKGNNWLEVTREEMNLVLGVGLADNLYNKTKGLLGTWNEDPNDDFQKPDGNKLSLPASDNETHYNFGELCKDMLTCKINSGSEILIW